MNIELRNEKFDESVPHPVLDDPKKMMRIIANPLYDKLTLSRAAHIRKSERLNRPREKILKSLTSEQTITTALPSPKDRLQSKSASRHQTLLPFQLLTPSSKNQSSPKNIKPSNHSRSLSVQSPLTDISFNNKKPLADGTIRYINSRHGLEVQHYISPNWLSIDLLSKEACHYQEKTFREMTDKKEGSECLLHSIYTSEYYRKRWKDLLLSYKQGYLTHAQWAKQNYQLYCLKTFYRQALQREQQHNQLYNQNIRQRRARSAFNQWKEAKSEDNIERNRSRLNTANSQHTTEVTSGVSNTSSPLPFLNRIDNNTTNRLSISTYIDNECHEIPIYQPIISSKNTSDILDKERWSLQAMLKRVVGLAEPLPPLPKIINGHQSSMTNLSIDSGFESSP